MNRDNDSDSSSEEEDDEVDDEEAELAIGRQSAFSSGVFRLMSQ